MESVQERMKRIGAYEKIASFMQKEKQPYEFKRKYAQIRAEEFKSECDRRGLNCHVSVGGLDSIVLFLFLREVCQIDVPGVSASTLEDKSIQRVHKAIGIINVPPLKRDDGKLWTKARVIQEFGFPVISKEIAGKIELLQNPTEKNKTVRHAIITGETGEYGGCEYSGLVYYVNKNGLRYVTENDGYEPVHICAECEHCGKIQRERFDPMSFCKKAEREILPVVKTSPRWCPLRSRNTGGEVNA